MLNDKAELFLTPLRPVGDQGKGNSE